MSERNNIFTIDSPNFYEATDAKQAALIRIVLNDKHIDYQTVSHKPVHHRKGSMLKKKRCVAGRGAFYASGAVEDARGNVAPAPV